MKIVSDSLSITERGLRNLARQPFFLAFALVQPILSLVLYSQLFQRIVELPGFKATSYITFILPGIVTMTSLMAGGWNGMGTIQDINRGVMDRLLVSPIDRAALVLGRLMSMSAVTTIQLLIILGLGYLLGARFDGGFLGIPILLICGLLVSIPFAALSNALALTVRREESVMGAQNFILMPLLFMSPVFMAKELMPRWMQIAANMNPVNWSVEAAREALHANTHWGYVLQRVGCLLAFAAICIWIATRAFRSYQKSV